MTTAGPYQVNRPTKWQHEGDVVKLPEMTDISLLDVDQTAASREREDVLKVWKDAVAEVRR
jgi:hypothetical protein